MRKRSIAGFLLVYPKDNGLPLGTKAYPESSGQPLPCTLCTQAGDDQLDGTTKRVSSRRPRRGLP